jgi:hypothetical protein
MRPFANLGGLLITSTMTRIKKLGVQIPDRRRAAVPGFSP